MRVADYIAKFLYDHGVRQVFLITGGGAMHLNDAFGRQPGLSYTCNHHEQACAIAAEGYYRASGRMAAVQVTSGPGGTNTLTGVYGQWTDSIPALYISGQVKQETTVECCRELGLRQLGDQEATIVDIVRPVTKYAAIVKSARSIRAHLEKAFHEATTGRMGPVWLDVPLDIQGAPIADAAALPGFHAASGTFDRGAMNERVEDLVAALAKSQRPVIVAGHGVRLAHAESELAAVIDRLKIPVICSLNGYDLVPTDHPSFIGRPGTIGTRAGNFALQNADLLLCLGTRNNIRQVSYTWGAFARAALKVVVDIDAAELNKPTVRPDLAIHADAGDFLRALLGRLDGVSFPAWGGWLEWCQARRNRYPVLRDQPQHDGRVHPYVFIDTLTRALPEGATLVSGDGTASVALFQAGFVKRGQRVFCNSGCAAMGYDLPAAIGAAVALGGRDVVCLAGDGSLQLNIQELQTVAHHRLPIKLFVLSNQGYQSIRQTQETYFGKFVGCSEESGLSFPNIERLATAYGLPTAVIERPEKLDDQVRAVLSRPGPVVCDVRLDVDYLFNPKLSSERKPDGRMVSKPLEDLSPLLPRDEFATNMLIPPWEPGNEVPK
ncbi:MAG: thiamine pyrophosphate-binding protein [Deltaproteobacteria bacterium]|nr:thiamine pyrophosphate-binding protein [Deltaproteobacteria bacterium]